MKNKSPSLIRFVLIFVIAILTISKANCQTIPDELISNPLNTQLKYIEERTRIYENYRAIREDMFQKITGNITDTLSKAKYDFARLNVKAITLQRTIDSLNNLLNTTKTNLEEMTRSKNSIKVIGIEIDKVSYNSVMWTIMAILLALLAIGFIIFKRTLIATFNTKKDLQDLKNEFEAYRKTSREAREKLTMDHFKEIQKLKGS